MSVLSQTSIDLVNSAKLPISLAAISLIVAEEDTSEDFYTKHYQQPEWPGGLSGVTVAIGYDLGYADATKIHRDFDGKVPDAMVQAMCSVAGIHGSAGYSAMLRVKSSISIPWNVAFAIFLHNDMPEWIATVVNMLPNAKNLPPDCLGALVSLAYNRGPSFNSGYDSAREMRLIRDHIAAGDFDLVPKEFRAMKRLWPGVPGLQERREHEAVLFEQGLAGGAPAPKPEPILPNASDVQRALNDGGWGVAAGVGVLKIDGDFGRLSSTAALAAIKKAGHAS